jgi:hypothetical protein
MREKITIFLFLLFAGLHVLIPERCFSQEEYLFLDDITPVEHTESFFAYQTNNNGSHNTIVRIDSNGAVKIIDTMGSSFRQSNLSFLNDSILLIESAIDNLNYYYNIRTRQITYLPICCLAVLSNDKHFFVTRPQHPDNEIRIYRLYAGDSVSFMGSRKDLFEVKWAYSDQRFIGTPFARGRTKFIKYILNPDMSVYDTIPANSTIMYEHRDILCDTSFHLEEGFISKAEYEKAHEAYLKDIKGIDDPAPGPDGYWFIRSSKTGKKKKIGFEGSRAYISFSGRHILFYPNSEGKYEAKVVSVKELIGE